MPSAISQNYGNGSDECEALYVETQPPKMKVEDLEQYRHVDSLSDKSCVVNDNREEKSVICKISTQTTEELEIKPLFPCLECDRKFQHEVLLKRHGTIKHGLKLECGVCHQKFNSKYCKNNYGILQCSSNGLVSWRFLSVQG